MKKGKIKEEATKRLLASTLSPTYPYPYPYLTPQNTHVEGGVSQKKNRGQAALLSVLQTT